MSRPGGDGRLYLARSVAPLAESPLAGHGIADVRVHRATTTGRVEHPATIETWTPVLEDGPAVRRPSLVLAHAPRLEPIETAPTARVRFESDGATVRAQIPFPAPTSFYGTGEVAGPLERTGRRTWLWNTDAWAYGEQTQALYQSHPWVVAVHADGTATGVLADSARRGMISIAPDGVELAFEREPFDVLLVDAPSPRDVSRALAALVGTLPLPPLWALGYHQCRWSYASADEAREVAAKLVEHAVPCTALWLDIDYMDGFRVFTWDGDRFPDPAGLVRELAQLGLRTVAIVDPAVKLDAGYAVSAEGLADAHFVLDADGRPARGRVWPGICHYPDFTREATRAWWAGHVERFAREAGLAGIWCDMNEPSAMRSPGATLPDDARHAGLGGGTHAEFHNLYGQLMAEATRQGVARAHPDARPFVLTRASHLSGARFAATWTGDNQARWEDLRWSVTMVLNLGLCGQPFAGPDIGGFAGDPDEELFVRWFELGAYLPFCRGHGEKTSRRKEPWAFGERALNLVRAALERRERLLPHLYTLFEESARTGLPIARPVFFADPRDPALRTVDDAFLLGDDLLVAPVVEPGARERRVLLPANEGGWFAFPHGGERLAGEVRVDAPLGVTPVFARAGSVVLESYGTLSTRATWSVFLDARGAARGTSYTDEGDGYGHESGRYRRLAIEARSSAGEVRVDVTAEGALEPAGAPRRIVVHGLGHEPLVHDDAGDGAARLRQGTS